MIVPLSEVGGKEGRNSGGKFGRIRRKGDSEDMVMKKKYDDDGGDDHDDNYDYDRDDKR